MKFVTSSIITAVLGLSLAACADQQTGTVHCAAEETTPTVEEAKKFIVELEAGLLDHYIRAERAAWVMTNFITHDTEVLSAQAHGDLMAFIARKAEEAKRFDEIELPFGSRRKLDHLKAGLPLLAPSDDGARTELSALAASLEGGYSKAKYCETDKNGVEKCQRYGDLAHVMTSSKKHEELLDAWTHWRSATKHLKGDYVRFAQLANQGAKDFGFEDVGVFWRSKYDMAPEEFQADLDRLWSEVKPFYDEIHCHVRAKLMEHYGDKVVDATGPIPAHLLGNMWAQEWTNVIDLVAPEQGISLDLTQILADNKFDVNRMFKTGEAFFVSLGFDPLPQTFWDRSLFTKPKDREVVCYASAWDIDWQDDIRIKMCTNINAKDFVTVHHELGHNFYQRAYKDQGIIFANSANDGFHEALGDLIALSITPSYLKKIGLIKEEPEQSLNPLMRSALTKIAFVPWALMVDRWRFDVFSGQVSPDQYNDHWWKLREQYQGVKAPIDRDNEAFDPAAKFHIPANTPYTRYFLAFLLQFQFHRGLCRAIGHEGPLHECSIYDNKQAGELIQKMMEMGSSRPWPEALKVITGEERVDGKAIIEYHQPLLDWLKKENANRQCGW